jgi:hypothetical protein
VLAALKAGGLVLAQPQPAVPLVMTALLVTVAMVWLGTDWIRGNGRASERR